MRRLKESERVLLLALFVVGVMAWAVYRYRVRIEAWWWHLRHGDVVAIADYRVPAPRNWFIQDVGEEDLVMFRLDTDDRSHGPARSNKPRFGAIVSLLTSRTASTKERLDFWTSFEASELRKKGASPVFKRFDFDGEVLSCVGGQKFSKMLKGRQFYESDPNVWMCETSGRLVLQLMATDPDMPQVWDIVSHIRKKF